MTTQSHLVDDESLKPLPIAEKEWQEADVHNNELKNSGELQRRREEYAARQPMPWSSYRC